VTTVSPTWRGLLAEKTGRSPGETVTVVQNGFDVDDLSPGAAAPSTDAFEVTHVGSLYASRNPTGLWRALRRLRDEGAVPALRIRLVGTVDPNVRTALQAQGLMDVTEIVPYVPHDEAVAYMRRAGLLLLSIESFPQDEGMMTGKIYEYLAAGRPIIGVGPPEGDAAALLQKTDGGQLFSRHDVSELSSFLWKHYAAWEEGEPRSGASSDAIASYRRSAQTKLLAMILDAVADTGAGV
jgi:glycosyltransferase involved in cell wall biosynthesis